MESEEERKQRLRDSAYRSGDEFLDRYLDRYLLPSALDFAEKLEESIVNYIERYYNGDVEKVTVEYLKDNPCCAVFHARRKITDFDKPHLTALQGVDAVGGMTNHSVTIRRGGCFRWDEVVPLVVDYLSKEIPVAGPTVVDCSERGIQVPEELIAEHGPVVASMLQAEVDQQPKNQQLTVMDLYLLLGKLPSRELVFLDQGDGGDDRKGAVSVKRLFPGVLISYLLR